AGRQDGERGLKAGGGERGGGRLGVGGDIGIGDEEGELTAGARAGEGAQARTVAADHGDVITALGQVDAERGGPEIGGRREGGGEGRGGGGRRGSGGGRGGDASPGGGRQRGTRQPPRGAAPPGSPMCRLIPQQPLEQPQRDQCHQGVRAPDRHRRREAPPARQ